MGVTFSRQISKKPISAHVWLFEGDPISYHQLFFNIYENPVTDKINSFILKLVPKMWIKWATSNLPGNVWIS